MLSSRAGSHHQACSLGRRSARTRPRLSLYIMSDYMQDGEKVKQESHLSIW
jgi:hypothetical protein